MIIIDSYRFSSTLYEYPPLPSGMTSSTTQISGSTYIATASKQDGVYPAFRAFNKLIQDAGWYTGAFDYNSSTGAYIGTQNLGGINGDWLKLQLSSAITLKSYSLTNRNNANDGQISWKFAILGSNDNTNWTIVDDKRANGLAWVNMENQVIDVTDFTNSVAYLYYAIVTTHTAGGLGLDNGAILSINEWRLFATQPVITEFPISAMSANSIALTGGTYIANRSSAFSASFDAFRAFDKDLATRWALSGPAYNSAGAYTGSFSTTTLGLGEWLQITMPTAITLTSYSITDFLNVGSTANTPISWNLGATNDATVSNTGNWTIIDTKTDVSWLSNAQETKTFTISPSQAFKTYRIVVTKLGNFSDGNLTINEWRLFGY